MKNKILTSLTAIALTAILIGCASAGRPIDPAKVAQIKKGESTRADVEALLGKPFATKETDGPEGKITTLSYLYTFASARPESFVPVVGMFAGGTDMQTHNTMIVIGTDGKVQSISDVSSGGSAKTGLSSDLPPSTNPQPAQTSPKRLAGPKGL